VLRTPTKDTAIGMVLAAGMALGAITPATAAGWSTGQDSSVYVDQSVLQTLGQPQTVPDLLFPGPQAPKSRLYTSAPDALDGTGRTPLMPKPGVKPRSRLAVTAPAAATTPGTPRSAVMPSPSAADVPPPPAVAAPGPTASAGATEQDIPEPAGEIAVADTANANPPETATAAPDPQEPAQDGAPAQPTTDTLTGTAAPESPAPEAAAPGATPDPATPTLSDDGLSIPFQAGEADLSDAAKADLDGIARRLQQDASLQVQVLAYAKAEADDTSRARRLSLSRALAVRSHLMEQGINSTRIEVRALGDKTEGGTPDRVDIRVSGT